MAPPIIKTVSPLFNHVGTMNLTRQASNFPLLFVAQHPTWGTIFYCVGSADNYRVTVFYYCPGNGISYSYTGPIINTNLTLGIQSSASFMAGAFRYFNSAYGNHPSFFVDPFAIVNKTQGVFLGISPTIPCGVFLNQVLISDGRYVIQYGAVSDSQNAGKIYGAYIDTFKNRVVYSGFIGRYDGNVLPFNVSGAILTSAYVLTVLQFSNGFYRASHYPYSYVIGRPTVFAAPADCTATTSTYNSAWGYSSIGVNIGEYRASSNNLDSSISVIPNRDNPPFYVFALDGSAGIEIITPPTNRNVGNFAIGDQYVAMLQCQNDANNNVYLYVANYSPDIILPIYPMQKTPNPLANFSHSAKNIFYRG
jgi:hypothetical protein